MVRDIPADRLLIETDAPYLLPRTVKPAPSAPPQRADVPGHIVEELARDRGEDVAGPRPHSTASARAFFRLPTS